ncbi:MAG: hypothetical protein WC710_13640 [Gallionella sp.]|jgi:hypothetical protein
MTAVIFDQGAAGADPWPVELQPIAALNPISVNTSASGNYAVHTPAAGKAVRLWWYQMAALPTNSAAVIAGLRFGAAGTLFGTTPLSQYGGAIAHHFRDGRAYVQGAADEVLYVNLSAAQTVYVNVETEEVVP